MGQLALPAMKRTTVSVTEFKAKCLGFLESVAREGREVLVTKRGRPVALVTAVRQQPPKLRGTWCGSVRIRGDLVRFSVADDWEAAT